VSTAVPLDPNEEPDHPAEGSGATSSERAQAQAVHELSEPERLDASEGSV
jgi:hypothetical protein